MHIIISRTDNIGDVVLTLPICHAIRNKFPKYKISFLGKEYTRAIAEACPYVDDFISYDSLCKLESSENQRQLRLIKADIIIFVYPESKVMRWAAAAKIPKRIATSGRWQSWLYCNHRILMSRKKSHLHEAQLNFKLLAPLGIVEIPSLHYLSKICYLHSYSPTENVTRILTTIPEGNRIILHPLGVSGIDWPIIHFISLAQILSDKNYHVIFTGTESDGIILRKHLPIQNNFHDVTGKFTLHELIQVMSQCQGLIGCSTGPLHIASALGITTLGLYSDRRPIHPGRWAPLGPRAYFLSAKETTDKELDIPVELVLKTMINALK